jgi:hypothetical protein
MSSEPAVRRPRPAARTVAVNVRTELATTPPPGMDSVRFPTYRKYQVLSRVVEQMNVREKRNVFQYMRDLMLAPATSPGSNDTFLPWYGITIGEFSLFQLMD